MERSEWRFGTGSVCPVDSDSMHGPEEIERYRRMSVAERLRETIELMWAAERALEALPLAERERRLRIIEAQKHSDDRTAWRRAAVT